LSVVYKLFPAKSLPVLIASYTVDPLSHNELEFVTSSVTFVLASEVAKVFVAIELEVENQELEASKPLSQIDLLTNKVSSLL
jgi:hypothetical protein